VLLNSQWNFGGSILLQTPYIDDREPGDGTPLERQGSWGTGWFFNSDSRKPVSFGGYVDHARGAPRYERSYDFGVTVNVRPLAQLETTLDVAFIRGDGTIRQIRKATPFPGGCSTACPEPAELDPATATQQPRLYLLAPQASRSLSITGRGTYAFSPRLTLQLYAQLFGAGISYGSPLRALAAPGKPTVRFQDMSPARPEDLPPDVDDRYCSLTLAQTGRVLALHSQQDRELSLSLAERGVLTDYRDDVLRLGPAPYLSDAQLKDALGIFREVASTMAP